MSRKPGRQFFANPGPTNIPDSVLRALSHAAVDFMDPDFMALYEYCLGGLKRVLKTSQDVFMYTASGHGSWEATLTNLFSPGDTPAHAGDRVFLGWLDRDGRAVRPDRPDAGSRLAPRHRHGGAEADAAGRYRVHHQGGLRRSQRDRDRSGAAAG